MKVISSLCTVAIAASAITACVDSPTTSSRTSALTATNSSVAWVAGKNQYSDVWPTGQSITSMYAIHRKGPGATVNGQNVATVATFVVWNDSTVGRIYLCTVGTNCQDLRNALGEIGSSRAYNTGSQYSWGEGGNGDTGTPLPTPHPNVDDPIYFGPDMLSAIVTNATAAHSANTAATQVAYEAP